MAGRPLASGDGSGLAGAGRWLAGAQAVVVSAAVLAFVAFLMAQHGLVYPYHDDWGYAVLSYATQQTGFERQDFSFAQLLAFLWGEYLNWSGRFGAFFTQILLFRAGLDAVRAFQVAAIVAALALAFRAGSDGRWTSPWLLLPACVFLGLPKIMLAGGLYWFSAAAGVVWGLPLLLGAAVLVRRGGRLGAVPALLLAASCTFHELMAAAAFAFAATLVAMHCLRERRLAALRRQAAGLAIVALGAVVALLAPGNFARKQVSQYPGSTLAETVRINLESLADFVLVHGWLVALVLLASLPPLAHRARPGWPVMVACWVLAVALGTVVAWPGPETMPPLWPEVLPEALPWMLVALVLAYGALLLRAAAVDARGEVPLALYAGAVATLCLLLLSPGVAGRAVLPFCFLACAPVVYALSAGGSRWARAIAGVAVAATLWPASQATWSVYEGYRANATANEANHARLESLASALREGRDMPREVVLYKLPLPEYGETMPYQRPLVGDWMKKFYGLPADVEFVWREVGEP